MFKLKVTSQIQVTIQIFFTYGIGALNCMKIATLLQNKHDSVQ